MIGVFLAPIFPASIAIEIELVGEERFGTLSGVQTWVGRLGVVGATAPLAALITVIGWRYALVWIAVIPLLAAVAVGIVLVVEKNDRHASAPRSRTSLMNVLSLLKSPGFAASVVFQGAGSAVVSGILGFWGSGWLKNVYGMGLAERSFELLVLALSWAASALIWGEAPRHFGRSATPLFWGAALIAVCLAIPALLPLDRQWLTPWFAMLGLAAGYYPALLSRATALLPESAVVHGIALVSTGSMVCVFVGQMASGLILDAFPGKPGEHPVEAYEAIFAAFAVAMIGSALVLWRSLPANR
jgi:predicted MFS family arabinose efflux permease